MSKLAHKIGFVFTAATLTLVSCSEKGKFMPSPHSTIQTLDSFIMEQLT